MRLKVNGVLSNEYPSSFSIGDYLRLKNIEAVPWLVISVNGKFYKRDKFDEIFLNENDVIELVYIRGGG